MQDEELPQPPERSAARSRLLRLAAILVGVVLATTAVVRIAGHTSSHAGPVIVTVPAPSPSASSSLPTHPADVPSGLTKPPAVLPVLRRLTRSRIAAAQAQCPRLAPSCQTTGETPTTVLATLRTYYPKARHLVAVSAIAYASGPQVAYRLLSTRAGRLTITVEVRHTMSGDGSGSQHDFGDTTNVYRTQTVGDTRTIELQISAPRNDYLPQLPMTNLVTDPGLLAIG